jgi:hypothetical protein
MTNVLKSMLKKHTTRAYQAADERGKAYSCGRQIESLDTVLSPISPASLYPTQDNSGKNSAPNSNEVRCK